MGESLRSALMAVSVMMVEQLGFEMMPWCSFTSPALISGTTSGTFGSRRKAEELSTNTAPERTIAGAKRSAMLVFRRAEDDVHAGEGGVRRLLEGDILSLPRHDLAGRAGACEQVQLPDGELALGEDLHHFLPDGAAGAENGYAILLHI